MTQALEDLAVSVAVQENAPPPEQAAQLEAEQAAAEAEQAEMQAKLQRTVEKLGFGILRAGRAFVARSMPEIRDEWTDDMLREPAVALYPVLANRVGKLLTVAGKYEAEAALVIAMIPLAFGYVNALERQQATPQLVPGTDGVHEPQA